MKSRITASALFFFALSIALGEVSFAGSQSNPETARPAQAPAGSARETADKPKKKKIWTNDEIATVGGPGSISVVGRANEPKSAEPNSSENTLARGASARQRLITGYRDRLRQLNNQLEATDKQISDLRNFKATNTSSSGGINMNHQYTMTPVEEQVKNLEEKRKQLQTQISAVEEQARKEGIEPGELR